MELFAIALLFVIAMVMHWRMTDLSTELRNVREQFIRHLENEARDPERPEREEGDCYEGDDWKHPR